MKLEVELDFIVEVPNDNPLLGEWYLAHNHMMRNLSDYNARDAEYALRERVVRELVLPIKEPMEIIRTNCSIYEEEEEEDEKNGC